VVHFPGYPDCRQLLPDVFYTIEIYGGGSGGNRGYAGLALVYRVP